MKGIVFTELLEMVEDRFSVETAEEIVDRAELPSGGAYTSVGTYDHRELLSIVGQLSDVSGMPARDLIMVYGRHLFSRFVELFPSMFEGVDCPLDFLGSVESHIHVEVRKLYPDAELPKFETTRVDEHSLDMVYRSERPFADVAEALITGCLEHFGNRYKVERATDEIAGGGTLFRVRKRMEALV